MFSHDLGAVVLKDFTPGLDIFLFLPLKSNKVEKSMWSLC